jgi:hypothetical protein
MPKPPEDPRVTDLRSYREAKKQEEARKAQARKAARRASSESFLGSRPRAGLILVAAILILVALTVLPALL